VERIDFSMVIEHTPAGIAILQSSALGDKARRLVFGRPLSESGRDGTPITMTAVEEVAPSPAPGGPSVRTTVEWGQRARLDETKRLAGGGSELVQNIAMALRPGATPPGSAGGTPGATTRTMRVWVRASELLPPPPPPPPPAAPPSAEQLAQAHTLAQARYAQAHVQAHAHFAPAQALARQDKHALAARTAATRGPSGALPSNAHSSALVEAQAHAHAQAQAHAQAHSQAHPQQLVAPQLTRGGGGGSAAAAVAVAASDAAFSV
jgi:hypothetical protein